MIHNQNSISRAFAISSSIKIYWKFRKETSNNSKCFKIIRRARTIITCISIYVPNNVLDIYLVHRLNLLKRNLEWKLDCRLLEVHIKWVCIEQHVIIYIDFYQLLSLVISTWYITINPSMQHQKCKAFHKAVLLWQEWFLSVTSTKLKYKKQQFLSEADTIIWALHWTDQKYKNI